MAFNDEGKGLVKREDDTHTSADTGLMALGVRSDTPNTSTSANGDYEPYKLTGQGAVWTTLTPSSLGGMTMLRIAAAATTNATVVKATPGNLYHIYAFNIGTVPRYLKMYDRGTSPVVGTSTVVYTVYLPAGGVIDLEYTYGVLFGTGIACAITSAVADTDTTAVSAANEVIVHFGYR